MAELARLIGQNDPFSEYGRDARPPAVQQPEADAHYESNPAPQYGNEPTQHYSEPVQHYSEPEPQYHEPAPQPQYQQPAVRPPEWPRPQSQPYAPRLPAAPAPRNDWPGPPARPVYPASDPFALPSDPAAPQAGARSYDNRSNASPNFPSPNLPSPGYPGQNYPGLPQSYSSQNYPGQTYPTQAYPDPLGLPSDYAQPEQPGYEQAGYPAAQDGQGFQPPFYPHQANAGAMPPPNDDEYYDDEPRGGRRKGVLTVAAVLALAVVGTAGAFGYRSLFSGPGTSSPPPVIRASGEPSKVAPPPANVDPSLGKFSYDRFGDAGKDEKVVGREEKPVDVSKVAAPPRTVFPGAPVVNSPSSKTSGTTAAANPPSAIGEPKRVRTVPIRPDQADGATQAPAQQPQQAQQATSVAPPRQASAASSPPFNRQAPPPVANAPLSLSPDANALPPPSVQESAPPPSRPSRIATAPASGGGGYLVQVSSQRSEGEAETAYRGIQSKYSSVLGSQPHTVRRADLGAKGVYYRAMVGPFGSREQAVQVCSSLKQAGGDCVVQQ